ncbi:globin-like [Apostichopus japonicus]|uniref:globin-like n=1 Tax=Stichopus japonicus TaxID=307972 RepID=UPI003AB4885C
MGCGPSNEGKLGSNGMNGSLCEPPPLPPTDPRLPLTARQKFSLEKSWKAVQRNAEGVGSETFLRLFRMEPSVQDYFPEFKGKNEEELRGLFSFETQSTLMINIFDEVVEKLDDMDSVINLLQKTAERHRQMGISAEVFRKIEEPFTISLKNCLGDRYTEKIEEIYSIFTKLVFDLMCQVIEEGS